MRTQLFLSLLLALACVAVQADEPMRCGNSLVTSSASLAELLDKCGEPAKKETRVEDVYVPNVNRAGTHKIGTKMIEIWTYQRSSQSLPVFVTIIDSKIKSIVTLP